MKLQVKNRCKDELGRAGWVNFFVETDEVCSARVTSRRGDELLERDLSRVAIVRLDDAAEFALALNASGELGPEILVENLVTHSDTSVRTDRVVVPNTCPNDVSQLLLTEAHEVIETLMFECTDERFDEGGTKSGSFGGTRIPC